MLEGIEVFKHSSIRINKENKVIYIDPYEIIGEPHDADIVLCTHTHFDHFSENDILKVKKDDTIILATVDAEDKIKSLGFDDDRSLLVIPDKKFSVNKLVIETVPAYNVNKNFHKKEYDWVGYIINIEGQRLYIAGDTDVNEDIKKVKCDIAFLPVGGTYTMTATEAAGLANEIKPEIAIPIHYGSVVGSKTDAEEFANMLNPKIKCVTFF